MRKILFFTIALCLVASGAAMAKDMTGRIGLGFVSTDAPVGGRYWINEKFGLDVGVGFLSKDLGDSTATAFTVNAGIPVVLGSVADRVNFYFRPGVQFTVQDDMGSGFDMYTMSEDVDMKLMKGTLFDITGSLEFEVFVTEDFTVSAAHGILVEIFSPDADNLDSTTDFSLFGNNWTQFGFHYYLPAK